MTLFSKQGHRSAYKKGSCAFIWSSAYVPGTGWTEAWDRDKKAKSYSQKIHKKTGKISGAPGNGYRRDVKFAASREDSLRLRRFSRSCSGDCWYLVQQDYLVFLCL